MKKFYVSAFVFAAMTLPSFAQEKAAPAARLYPKLRPQPLLLKISAFLAVFVVTPMHLSFFRSHRRYKQQSHHQRFLALLTLGIAKHMNNWKQHG